MKKLSFVALLLCAAVAPSQAQTISEALKECGRQQNSLKRLVCYDKVVQSLDRYSGAEELMNVPAPLPARNTSAARSQTNEPREYSAATPSSPESSFGMENRREADSQDKIYADIVKIQKNARKRMILTLSNGHVWNQTDGESLQLKVGQTVYVERGALGAFYLSKDSANRRIRVKRSK